jgi:hypothetical protein
MFKKQSYRHLQYLRSDIADMDGAIHYPSFDGRDCPRFDSAFTSKFDHGQFFGNATFNNVKMKCIKTTCTIFYQKPISQMRVNSNKANSFTKKSKLVGQLGIHF